jgi:translation initiation factor eIF-2B subunit delta
MSGVRNPPATTSSDDKAAKAAEKAKRKAEFEAKRAAELQQKKGAAVGDAIMSKADLKKQRREQQEQQRAAKSLPVKELVKEKEEKKKPVTSATESDASRVPLETVRPAAPTPTSAPATSLTEKLTSMTLNEEHIRSSLFPQIPVRCQDIDEITKGLGVRGDVIHSVIIKAGVRMNLKTISGSTPRCLALMVGLKALITDYRTPVGKALDRDLPDHIDRSMEFLNRCRPLTTGMINGAAYVRRLATNIPTDRSDADSKQYLIRMIDEYIEDEINCAMKSITAEGNGLIRDDDVILTIGSSLKIKHVLYAAVLAGKRFKVIVVDCGPDYRGLEMVTFLSEISEDLSIKYLYLNSIMHIMNDVSKILVGGHSVLANGYVIAGMGCSQVALMAKSHNVPFIVCCETNEFADSVHTDAFVFNEAALPQEYLTQKNHKLVKFFDSESSKKKNLTMMNLLFDTTPPEYVSMIVTEKGIFPCHAVPAIIRRNYNKLQ